MTRDVVRDDPTAPDHGLRRVMEPKLLLLLIVGDILGTGVYALTGQVAARSAAPRGRRSSWRSPSRPSPRSRTSSS
jgi:hypothetical protein